MFTFGAKNSPHLGTYARHLYRPPRGVVRGINRHIGQRALILQCLEWDRPIENAFRSGENFGKFG